MKLNELTADQSWTEANREYLVAEFAWLKHRLDLATGARVETQAVRPNWCDPATLPAIDRLAELVGLSEFERDVLLLCAGVEMDSELAARCAEVHGHPQRAAVTFGLAMAVLPEPHWSAVTPARPLRSYRLVDLEGGAGLTTASLRIDERVLHYLAGVNLLDSRLHATIRPSPLPTNLAAEHGAVVARLVRALQTVSEPAPALLLSGDDSPGHEDVATLAAQHVGQQLYVVRAEDLPAPGPDLDQLSLLWQREARLLPAILLIQCGTDGVSPAVRRLAETLPGALILASREPARLSRPFLRLDVDKPRPSEQRRLWEAALGPAAAGLNGALDAVAEQFRLSARAISTTARVANNGGEGGVAGDLWDACRALARPRLEDLAQRIVPAASWDDLVLPEAQTDMLQQLAAQVRQRLTVYETWGFAARGRRGLGVTALFAGESGTGKTLAAEVLAGELGLDLYQIDLSAVVSKYIGETEKNLKQVFDAAEDGGALLLFDEADALFGKRSEVKDSHDRYANIEVSYLLQRMEAFQGLAILTTNLRSSLDKAFQRRLRFTVTFPFPDANQREAIWLRVFPRETPIRNLDPRKLAQLNLAGGNIRNIALNAAFLAADDGSPVEMCHVLQAARFEALKLERPLSEAETRGWR
jgi:predicted nucleic acid-binding protein